MASVLVTKIDADLRAERDNTARSDGLAEYCTNPQNSQGDEKCVAFRAFNFSEENPDIELIKEEIRFDIDKALRKDSELVSHWVMSFKGAPEPKEEAIYQAAQNLFRDLNYGPHNKFYVAIHRDTDHLHAHLVACKVDPFTGRIAKEGWWKNESQKSIARSAYELGWQLEPNALFRVPPNPRMEKVKIQTVHGEREISRPVVVKRGSEKDAPSIRCYAAKAERRTGIKSGQRILQEILRDFVAEHEQDFPRWKCGDFHRELAQLGITCERVERGGQYGLTFTLDGENYESATSTCPQLSYKKLLDKLSAKSWRDAREEHKKIAQTVRAEYQPQQLMPQEQQKVVYNKDIIAEMRKIPTAAVWKALGLPPKEKNSSGRRIVNSFDVCMARGMSFSESADFLARHFPEVLKNQDASIDVQGMLEGVKNAGVKISPENMPRAEQVARTMGAMRADKLNLTVKSANHLVSPQYLDQSLSDICKKLDLLTEPGNEIFASPVMSKGKRAIIISSVKPGLYQNFPDPSLRLATEKGEQAVYVLGEKSQYDEFYDYLNDRLNSRFGDPAQPVMIPVPGLSRNVKIVSTSQKECKELDQYARTVYEQWKSGATEAKLPELENDSLYNNREAARLEEKLVEEGIRERNRLIDEYFEKRNRALSLRITQYQMRIVRFEKIIRKPTPRMIEIAKQEAKLARVPQAHPPAGGNMMGLVMKNLDQALEYIERIFELILLELEKRHEQRMAEIQSRYESGQDIGRLEDMLKNAQSRLDESRICAQKQFVTITQARQIDIFVSRKLYAEGASPDEVYTFLRENAQTCNYIENKKTLEKICRKIAVNSAPASLIGVGSNWQAEKKPCRKRPAYAPGIDTEQDRKRPVSPILSNGQHLTQEEKRNG